MTVCPGRAWIYCSICFPIKSPGMGRFKLFYLVFLGYGLDVRFWVVIAIIVSLNLRARGSSAPLLGAGMAIKSTFEPGLGPHFMPVQCPTWYYNGMLVMYAGLSCIIVCRVNTTGAHVCANCQINIPFMFFVPPSLLCKCWKHH